jgi:hypothetical protein
MRDVLSVQKVLRVLVLRVLVLRVLAVLLVLGVLQGSAGAADRYALIVTGAHGEPTYEQQYAQWRQSAAAALLEKLGFDAAHIVTLFEGGDPQHAATAETVRRSLIELRGKTGPDDVVFVLLIGHGSFDGAEAKFNLVGPDLTSTEWASLLKPIQARTVIVNSTASSFPFLEHLSGPRRIVITATDSAAQRFDTVFPEYFIRALTDPAADLDKNGRVSIWEAFSAASLGVRRYYAQRGQLATERSLIDDDGDGVGREAGEEGKDGSAASRLYLDPEIPGAPPTDEELLRLLQRRTSLQIEADELRMRRQLMTPEEYRDEFEKLMLALARVSRDIRNRQKT